MSAIQQLTSIRRLVIGATASVASVVVACTEHLPVGPSAFGATLAVPALPDTLVVGDLKSISALTNDGAGNAVSGLTYAWALSDSGVLGFGASESASGATRTLLAKRTGVSTVTLRLPDLRFATTNVTKRVTAVLARLQLTTARDTSVRSIGDTIVVRATGFVKSGATTVASPLSALSWTLRGTGATAMLAGGDSARVIALSNGVDTVIVAHPYCLAGARCADTALVRVSQVMRLALAAPTLSAWSFNDTVSTAATLKDLRGNGQIGTYLKFFPQAAADSAVVTVTALNGLSQPTNGSMAVSKLIAKANGIARVTVRAYSLADALIDTASISVTVRQIAVRTTVFPLQSSVTHGDSVPLRARAIDARGTVIADATVALTPVSGTLSGFWAIGSAPSAAATQHVWGDVAGVAAAANHAGAPAVTVARDTAAIQSLPAMTVVAGSDSVAKVVAVSVRTYAAVAVPSAWVRYVASGGVTTADSIQTGADGSGTVTWTAPTTVGTYRLTVLKREGALPVTAADSAGLILARRTVQVIAAAAHPTTSRVTPTDTLINAAGTTTLSLAAKDAYGNVTTTIVPADIVTTVLTGTIGAWTCASSTCTATYTAPITVGTDTVSVKLAALHTLGSPFAIRAKPGAASLAISTISASAASIVANGTATSTLTVQLKDANGNNLTATGGTVTIVKTTGPTLTLTAVTDNADGPYTATVSGTASGTATFTASLAAAALTHASNPVTVALTAGTATKLAFTTQPSASTVSDVVFAQQPVVTVQDANGNTVTGSTAAIALTLTTGDGTLAVTTTVSAVAGVATFAGLKITSLIGGANYVLTAATAGLTSATTTPAFTIVAPSF